MVKPPKSMQPEAVNLKKAGRSSDSAFHADSFRQYMARKIDLQRQQFHGDILPPSPTTALKRKYRRQSQMTLVLRNLKTRHGGRNKRRQRDETLGSVYLQDDDEEIEDVVEEPDQAQKRSATIHDRPDLFLRGVTILVNGFTNPDADTLQRIMLQYGGSLEKYETTRVTHIVACTLSTAKAKIYANQRHSRPVVYPQWIVDCVDQQRLLPHGPYILKEIQRLQHHQVPSVASFFGKPFAPKRATAQTNIMTEDNSAVVSVREITASVSQPSPNRESPTEHPEATRNTDPATTTLTTQDSDHVAKMKGMEFSLTSPLSKSSTSDKPKSPPPTKQSTSPPTKLTNEQYINGRQRTVGTDPHFLKTFFQSSRLSFIGSYQQRVRQRASQRLRQQQQGKQRYVMHVDMDCFFASVVLRNYPQHRDKPVVICHQNSAKGKSTSECATCNYHARKYGIRKGMYLGKAEELCPDLIMLQYDFVGYEEVSDRVKAILEQLALQHDGVVEHVSCDEAYVEIYDNNDTNIVSLLAEDIRKRIWEATDCTATVGVSRNKLLAKLTTDRVKPNRTLVTVDYKDLLKDLELRRLHGIGYRLSRKLRDEGLVTVQDVWDLGDDAETKLCRILGPGTGKKAALACLGEDLRPVQAAERKTIGAECNYGVRFDGPFGVDYMVKGLAAEVHRRMEAVGVKGSKVTLKVKQRKEGAPPPPKFLGHGSCHNLSRSCDLPCVTNDTDLIARASMDLFEEMKVPLDDVRGVGIVVSKLGGNDEPTEVQATPRDGDILKWIVDTPKTADEGETAVKKVDLSNVTYPQRKTSANSSKPAAKQTFDSNNNPLIDLSVSVDEVDSDILLPPLSQIRLSQVEALPSSMRDAILAEMEHGKKPEPQVLRTDRSQLVLPFAPATGAVVQRGKKRALSHVVERRPREAKSPTKAAASSPPKTAPVNKMKEQRLAVTDFIPGDLYKDQIVPLHAFLDSHHPPTEDAVEHVREFFSTLIQERSLDLMVVLMRSMRRRGDAWSSATADALQTSVQEQVLMHKGYQIHFS